MREWPAEVPEEWRDQVVIADARKACARLPDGCIDLIFTDPPYTDIDAYRWLAIEAPRLLRPGGWCYVYSGNLHALTVGPILMKGGRSGILGKHRQLDYAGTICLMGSGGYMNRWRLIGVWKPIFRLCNGLKYARDVRYATNVLSGRRDKRYHGWGQGAGPAYQAIRLSSEPGDLILDPFCGGGTTACVAVGMGRKALTFETDPAAATIARERLAIAHLPLGQYQLDKEAMDGRRAERDAV